MSTLTKILIVLLTISSIFLCGIVVTYVANADNYMEKYQNLKSSKDSLSKEVDSLTKQVNEKIAQKRQVEDKLNDKISSLNTEFTAMQTELGNSEREKAELLQKVNNWTSITKDFYQTNDKQGQLLKNTLGELERVRTEQIKQSKELNETTAALVEKMAIIETLQTKTKRLLEEKSELQSRLEQIYQPMGVAAAKTAPVTQQNTKAMPVMPKTNKIGLNGLVTAVDVKNSMAGISIGSADGVKEGMKFHVVRDDKFVCDILIIDVDSEQAVGVLDLVQKQPKVGDKVSTNL
ncbi:MAG: hypothetical protein KAQ89_03500 [Planctomycetes bacterium]|nr:hypothetical protein [Planctomycetota bacterium]